MGLLSAFLGRRGMSPKDRLMRVEERLEMLEAKHLNVRVKALEGQVKALNRLDEKMADLWKRQKYLGERAGRDDELLTELKSKAAEQVRLTSSLLPRLEALESDLDRTLWHEVYPQDKLRETVAGEPKTVKSTTPTCGHIDGKSSSI